MKVRKLLGLLITLAGCVLTMNVYAADTVAKEDTTPPVAEGALTAEQIPPISTTIGKPMENKQTPATPAPLATPPGPAFPAAEPAGSPATLPNQ